MKRVVITGSGAISALGYNTMEHYNSLMNGTCGIKTLEFADSDSLSIKIGAMVGEYSADQFFSLRDLSFFDSYTQFAVIAAREAMSQ